MIKKAFALTCIPLIVLSGCGKPSEVTEDIVPEKQALYIQTSSVDELSTTNTITKNGRITGAQAVVVTSQVPGRVADAFADAGSTVDTTSTIIKLSDSNGSFTFNAQRAQTQLESAQINYAQTQTNLNKAITDTARGVQQAKIQANAANQ